MLPRIQDLFDAFQKFSATTQRAGINYAKWEIAREELRKDLDKLGIADHFDWSLE